VQPHFEKRLDRGVRQGPATDQPLVILLEAQQLYEADRAAVTILKLPAGTARLVVSLPVS
jgi:hypothetical protein